MGLSGWIFFDFGFAAFEFTPPGFRRLIGVKLLFLRLFWQY